MIRTYSRKPEVCRYIEGATSLCRLCLRAAHEAVPIFADDAACSALALRVMICVGLEVKKEDCLPNLICIACFNELEQYYAFRKRCEVSYQKLKSHLQATRIRQATEAVTSENDSTKENNVNQDENMNNSDLGPVVEDGRVHYDKEMPLQEGDVGTDIRAQTAAEVEPLQYEEIMLHCSTTEPEQLSAALAELLRARGALARGARLRLRDPAGAVLHMELAEEEVPAAPERRAARLIAPLPAAPEPVTVFKEGNKTSRGVQCAECGRTLASSTALRRHARTHSGERPFACPDCARRFAQKEVMRRHRLVHQEERPHKCASCPKSFTQRNSLRLHERSHLPPTERALPLHRCPHCPKLFLYASGLSRHMMAHSGRVYECGACRRRFADKSSVLRHVRRARHPEPAQNDPIVDLGTEGV